MISNSFITCLLAQLYHSFIADKRLPFQRNVVFLLYTRIFLETGARTITYKHTGMQQRVYMCFCKRVGMRVTQSEKNRRVKICTRKIGNMKIHWTGFGRAGRGNQSDRVDG